MKKFIFGTFLAGMVAVPAFAETYVCTLNKQQDEGPILIIVHDRDSGEVQIADAYSEYYKTAPTDIRVEADNDKRATYRWNLQGTKNKFGQYAVRLNFNATILKKNKKLVYGYSPIGYLDNFRYDGRCKVES